MKKKRGMRRILVVQKTDTSIVAEAGPFGKGEFAGNPALSHDLSNNSASAQPLARLSLAKPPASAALSSDDFPLF
jgi:hypothetical protein